MLIDNQVITGAICLTFGKFDLIIISVTDSRYGCTNENGTNGPNEKWVFFYQCDPNSGRKWVMPASRGLYWDVQIGGQNWINSISYDNERNPQCELGAEPWQNANNLDQAKCECIDCDESDTTAACARL